MAFRFGDLSFCFVGGRTVVLDLKRDRYFGVGPEQTRLLRGALESRDELGLANQLIELRLVPEATRHEAFVVLSPCPVRRSAHEDHHGRTGATFLDATEVIALIVATWAALKFRPLIDVVRNVERRRRKLPGDIDNGSSAQAATRRFLAVRGLAPIEPICLLDSLALVAYLARRGIASDLVLGVDLEPFEAHAWVQHGDCALNETAHRAAMLTPILVV
jgi:hypothetical protein